VDETRKDVSTEVVGVPISAVFRLPNEDRLLAGAVVSADLSPNILIRKRF
jgi:hypothetical protein